MKNGINGETMTLKTVLAVTALLLMFSSAGAEMFQPGSKMVTSQNDRFTGRVELYVTSWCGYCKKALEYVKSNNINYVAYDIEKDSVAHKRYRELGGHGIPLIVIGTHRMSGYSQEGLEYYLNNPGK